MISAFASLPPHTQSKGERETKRNRIKNFQHFKKRIHGKLFLTLIYIQFNILMSCICKNLNVRRILIIVVSIV